LEWLLDRWPSGLSIARTESTRQSATRDFAFASGSILLPETFAEEITTILDEMAVSIRIIDLLNLEERTDL
jgi:hypothetical protein